MGREVESKWSLADSEFVSLTRDACDASVRLVSWDDALLTLRFVDAVALIETDAGDISGVVVTDEMSALKSRYLDTAFETRPAADPWLTYSFLNLDNEPVIEVVARRLEITRDRNQRRSEGSGVSLPAESTEDTGPSER